MCNVIFESERKIFKFVLVQVGGWVKPYNLIKVMGGNEFFSSKSLYYFRPKFVLNLYLKNVNVEVLKMVSIILGEYFETR